MYKPLRVFALMIAAMLVVFMLGCGGDEEEEVAQLSVNPIDGEGNRVDGEGNRVILARVQLEIDPHTGAVDTILTDLRDDTIALASRIDLNGRFTQTGAACTDCGSGCDVANLPTRQIVVNLKVNDDAPCLTNVAIVNETSNVIEKSISSCPLKPGDEIDAKVTVQLTDCDPFSVWFDLEGNVGRIVAVLFTGFSTSVGSETPGMDILNYTLNGASELGGNPNRPFSSEVFRHFEQEEALNFINEFNDICCLVLIGHSLGGDSVLELASQLPADDCPSPQTVDLTIQIENVGFVSSKLPSNVDTGINYFQISTGFFEPQGLMVVDGAENINVEDLFFDTTITHTNIDSNLDLHNEIVIDIVIECIDN